MSGLEHSVAAVSYTHLDVYKRQEREWEVWSNETESRSTKEHFQRLFSVQLENKIDYLRKGFILWTQTLRGSNVSNLFVLGLGGRVRVSCGITNECLIAHVSKEWIPCRWVCTSVVRNAVVNSTCGHRVAQLWACLLVIWSFWIENISNNADHIFLGRNPPWVLNRGDKFK